jgi:hypothetical protein
LRFELARPLAQLRAARGEALARLARHDLRMPILVEHHVAASVNPARIAAQLASAAIAVEALAARASVRKDLVEVVEEERELARAFNAMSAGQLVETLRRARYLSLDAFPGPPEPGSMLIEGAAALTEAFHALDFGRAAAERAGASAIAEGVPGRHGELAVELAQWSGLLREMAGGQSLAAWPKHIEWGPESIDPHVRGPVALVLTTCFLVSAAMSIRVALDDAGQEATTDSNWDELYPLVVRVLSWGQETAAGAVMLTEQLIGGERGEVRDAPDPAVAALTSVQAVVAASQQLRVDALASPLEGLQGDAATGLGILVERCERHEELVAHTIAQ